MYLFAFYVTSLTAVFFSSAMISMRAVLAMLWALNLKQQLLPFASTYSSHAVKAARKTFTLCTTPTSPKIYSLFVRLYDQFEP